MQFEKATAAVNATAVGVFFINLRSLEVLVKSFHFGDNLVD